MLLSGSGVVTFRMFITPSRIPPLSRSQSFPLKCTFSVIYSVGFCRGSRVEGRGSRVEGRGSRVEGRGSRVEGRGSRIEGRGSRVEGRGSRVERRASRVEGVKKFKKLISYLKL